MDKQYYSKNKISAIMYIHAMLYDFDLGSAVKYVFRYKYKDNPTEDIRKAKKYTDYYLELIEQNEHLDERNKLERKYSFSDFREDLTDMSESQLKALIYIDELFGCGNLERAKVFHSAANEYLDKLLEEK